MVWSLLFLCPSRLYLSGDSSIVQPPSAFDSWEAVLPPARRGRTGPEKSLSTREQERGIGAAGAGAAAVSYCRLSSSRDW
nr:unnamed protein product [Digitaria exilis]